jgi:hypothetical protein
MELHYWCNRQNIIKYCFLKLRVKKRISSEGNVACQQYILLGTEAYKQVKLVTSLSQEKKIERNGQRKIKQKTGEKKERTSSKNSAPSEKFTVAIWSIHLPPSVESEGSLSCSQQPAFNL